MGFCKCLYVCTIVRYFLMPLPFVVLKFHQKLPKKAAPTNFVSCWQKVKKAQKKMQNIKLHKSWRWIKQCNRILSRKKKVLVLPYLHAYICMHTHMSHVPIRAAVAYTYMHSKQAGSAALRCAAWRVMCEVVVIYHFHLMGASQLKPILTLKFEISIVCAHMHTYVCTYIVI